MKCGQVKVELQVELLKPLENGICRNSYFYSFVVTFEGYLGFPGKVINAGKFNILLLKIIKATLKWTCFL